MNKDKFEELMQKNEGLYFTDSFTDINYRIINNNLEFYDKGLERWVIDSDFDEDGRYTNEMIELINKNSRGE